MRKPPNTIVSYLQCFFPRLQALQNNAEMMAMPLLAGDFVACKVKNVIILKACTQVVAGTNTQYVAKAVLKCGKKTVNRFYQNTFLTPL